MAKDTDKKDKKEKGRSAGPNILQRAGKFFREVYGELKKVTWPTPKELIAYTATVLAFIVIISVMIGGVGSFFGPIIGVVIFQMVDELILRYTESTELVMGVILIVVVMFMPKGFVGLFEILRDKISRRGAPKAEKEKVS